MNLERFGYQPRRRYGLYTIELEWWQVPGYRVSRARDWVMDRFDAFRRWRNENKTWRRLAGPFVSFRWWVRGLNLPDTLEGQNRRGVIDWSKLSQSERDRFYAHDDD